MDSTIKIYLCQLNFHVGDLDKNYEKILSARKVVENKGGDLCVFSELSITGYPPEDLVLRQSFIQAVDEIIKKLLVISKDGGPAVIVGFPRLNNNKLMNSAALITDGDISIIDKFHLPNYGVFDEKRYFQPGDKALIFSLKGKKFGVLICEDIYK